MNVIVTGSSKGLGFLLAKKLLEEGHNVGINYNNSPSKAIQLNKAYPQASILLPFDVSNYEEVKDNFNIFLEKFDNLDVLINNAGYGGQPQFFIRVKAERHRKIVETNLIGTINCSKISLPIMLKCNQGLILNISSISSNIESTGLSTYSVTKFAIDKLSELLNNELVNKNVKIISLPLPPIKDVGMFADLPIQFHNKISPEMKNHMALSSDVIAKIMNQIYCWKNENATTVS